MFSPQTYTITETVQKIAESYDCKPIEGMLSHQLEQNRIDGEKTIIQVRVIQVDNYSMGIDITSKIFIFRSKLLKIFINLLEVLKCWPLQGSQSAYICQM